MKSYQTVFKFSIPVLPVIFVVIVGNNLPLSGSCIFSFSSASFILPLALFLGFLLPLELPLRERAYNLISRFLTCCLFSLDVFKPWFVRHRDHWSQFRLVITLSFFVRSRTKPRARTRVYSVRTTKLSFTLFNVHSNANFRTPKELGSQFNFGVCSVAYHLLNEVR